jgi:cytochrome c
MRIFLWLAVMLLLTPGSALAVGAGDPAKGKLLFDKHCLVCHGPQGKGEGRPDGR